MVLALYCSVVLARAERVARGSERGGRERAMWSLTGGESGGCSVVAAG